MSSKRASVARPEPVGRAKAAARATQKTRREQVEETLKALDVKAQKPKNPPLEIRIEQAGLSWSTILQKRESYRRAFDGFDPRNVACFDARRIRKLLADPGIVRNRLKVTAAVRNAKAAMPRSKFFMTRPWNSTISAQPASENRRPW